MKLVMGEEIRLHEGELNVMELLWANDQIAAKDISNIIKNYIGWEKNTTYTVINRLIAKGAVSRDDPGFICRALITKEKVQEIETKALLDKVFGGEISNFINDYLRHAKLTPAQIVDLESVIIEHKRRS
jgi:predicted transcriptional regulator